MPEAPPREVTPHLLAALAAGPDALPPVLWVYPWHEYHDLVAAGSRLDEPLAGDWLVAAAINAGLPLGGVVDAGAYVATAGSAAYAGTVLLSRVPDEGTPL